MMVCVVLALTALALRTSEHLVSPNYNLSSEANGLYGALRVGSGKSLYAKRHERPYHLYLYGPLQGWLAGGILTLIPQAELHTKVLVVRTLSLLCFGFCIVLLWRVFLRKYVGVETLLLLIPLALSRFTDYAATSRNDMFTLLLEVGAVIAFLRYTKQAKIKWVALFIFFAFAAFFTRPPSGILMASAFLWALLDKRKSLAFGIALSSILFFGVLFVLDYVYGGAVLDSMVYANIRGIRPFSNLLDQSLLSFLGTYMLFAFLVAMGIRKFGNVSNLDNRFLMIHIGLTFIMACSAFFRAGGDVNYFFPAIFFGSYFAARYLTQIISKPIFQWLVCAQLIIIFVTYTAKTHFSSERSSQPYAEAAEIIRREQPGFIFLRGSWAGSLAIHLMEDAYHGPDITNMGEVAKNGHPALRWILRDLEAAVENKAISTAVWAEPNCNRWARYFSLLPIKKGTFNEFSGGRFPLSWLCIYDRAPENQIYATLPD